MKRNKRRERRYSQKLNLDDMKKAIQIQKEIKVKVSTSEEKNHQNKSSIQEDRLHQLRRAEDVLAQDPADYLRSLLDCHFGMLGEFLWENNTDYQRKFSELFFEQSVGSF